ncbi:MAG: long-chain fatty acid--CoA ligase [Desulfobacteraceae bacterium 4572_35.1]|nr:MAG: long-chain fatty acid--CoA ligase [Desulfobacteraceae bacterium 4572_35.1]
MPNTTKHKDTLFDMFLNSCSSNAGHTAFIYCTSSAEFRVSYEKLFDDALILAKAFKEHKIHKGSKVMLLSDNRYAWIVTDFALLSHGAISVPRGSDTTTPELEFILQHAECEFLIIETEKLLKTHEKMLKGLKNLKSIFVIEGNNSSHGLENTYSYNDILNDRIISNEDRNSFITQRHDIEIDDIFTLIYTSGTTGVPKGVLLSHKNIMYNVCNLPELIDLKQNDRWLSILPSWHIFERASEYIALSKGCCIVYSAVKTFAADLEKYQPTMVATVPRLWESMYNKINQTLEKQNPRKARIFKFLVTISSRYNYWRRLFYNQLPVFSKRAFLQRGWSKFRAGIMLLLLAPLNLLAKKKLSLVQQKFGGKLRMAISGGGSLPTYLDEWIDAIGIRIVNAYGMTECAPAIAGRSVNCEVFGTLGPPTRNTELRIVGEKGEILAAGEAGEIQLRGDQVFSGYYKNDEENKAAFTTDGFFKTGDLGKLTLGGELVITGRSKEIIVLASGENIDPSRIEAAITKLPFVSDAVLVGQDKKGLGALIVPDFEQLHSFMGGKNEHNAAEINKFTDKQTLDQVKSEINRLLHPKHGFKPFEKLQNIHLLDKEFTIGEELTNTMKKKRHVIEVKYKEIISKLLK